MDRDEQPSREPYVYSRLPANSIRVLRRLGNTQDGLLHFSFEIIDILQDVVPVSYLRGTETDPGRLRYHCLSYTWGNPLPDGDLFHDEFIAAEDRYSGSVLFPIVCDGKLLQVQRNLYEGLSIFPTRVSYQVQANSNGAGRRTWLHCYAGQGECQRLFELISRGADVNSRDVSRKTPLHYAAEMGRYDCVRILLKAHAEWNLKDTNDDTPCLLASRAGHLKVADLLDRYSKEGPSTLFDDIADFKCQNPDDYIWIDAICINQQDLQERGAQVQLMDSIYRGANYVIVWLGVEDRYTAHALSALSKISDSFSEFVDSKIIPFESKPLIYYETASVPHITQGEWDGLASFFLRQWFSRIWIIQEVVNCGSVHMYIGEHSVEWMRVSATARAIQARTRGFNWTAKYTRRHSTLPASATSYATMIDNLQATREAIHAAKVQRDPIPAEAAENFSLFQLMIYTASFRATDLRDKCFALLPLTKLNPNRKELIQPDYTITVEEAFLGLAKHVIEETGDLRVLSLVVDSAKKKLTLPSWVPDLTSFVYTPIPHWNYQPCLDILANATPYKNGLHVGGLHFDTVAHIPEEYSTREFNPTWLSVLAKLQSPSNYQYMGQPISEALWRTLCANRSKEFPVAPRNFGDMFKLHLMALIYKDLGIECFLPQDRITILNNMFAAAKSTNRSHGKGPQPNRGEGPSIPHGMQTPAGEMLMGALYLELIANTLETLDDLRSKGAGEFLPSSRELEEYLLRQAASSTSVEEDVHHQTWTFFSAHSSVLHGRRLFVTLKGYLGIGPRSMCPGDAVYVVAGAKMPLILRHGDPWGIRSCMKRQVYPDKPEQLRLIGPAYVHGIMQGEAITGRHIQNIDFFRGVLLV